jgi:SseB protein N-terminal domain
MSVRSIGAPFKWVKRGGLRRALIIYPLVLVTLGYVAVGIWLAATDSSWRAADTFSMIAGCIFFVIGTSLAVAHETNQEVQKEILDEVIEITGKTWKQLDPNKPVQTAGVREVLTGQPVMPLQGDSAAIATEPETASAPRPPASEAQSSEAQDGPGSWEEVWDKLAELNEPSPLKLAQDSLDLFKAADEKEKALQRFALESAIKAHANTKAVESLLKVTQVYVLGHPAGDTSTPGYGTESDILHFTIDEDHGEEHSYMPIFTRPDAMRKALLRNPDWQELSILEVDGGALIADRDHDVTLVVNPWSKYEWQLEPGAGQGS